MIRKTENRLLRISDIYSLVCLASGCEVSKMKINKKVGPACLQAPRAKLPSGQLSMIRNATEKQTVT